MGARLGAGQPQAALKFFAISGYQPICIGMNKFTQLEGSSKLDAKMMSTPPHVCDRNPNHPNCIVPEAHTALCIMLMVSVIVWVRLKG
jgi:hypothetical protein